MAVITISRQCGSGGDEVAALVRDRLGYRYFDKRMMRFLGAQTLTPSVAAEAPTDPRQARTLVETLFSNWPESAGDTATRHRGVEPDASESTSLELVQSLIRSAAEQGDVVVVGRGGQLVLRDMPGVLHVRIVAPLEMRVERVMREEGLVADAARALVKQRDKASADYIARFYHVDVGDPQIYDLVINTARVTPAMAADLVVKAVGALPAKT